MDSRGDGEEQLVDESEGVFVVTTADGVAYRLDMDERVITTLRDLTASTQELEQGRVRVLTLVTCRVGAPMVLLLDRGEPGVWFTRRVTAAVIWIERVDAHPHPPRAVS